MGGAGPGDSANRQMKMQANQQMIMQTSLLQSPVKRASPALRRIVLKDSASRLTSTSGIKLLTMKGTSKNNSEEKEIKNNDSSCTSDHQEVKESESQSSSNDNERADMGSLDSLVDNDIESPVSLQTSVPQRKPGQRLMLRVIKMHKTQRDRASSSQIQCDKSKLEKSLS